MAEEKINVNGTVITFFSTASAVGKTLVSCNVAAELARLGHRVCLADLDLQFGDVCNYLQLMPQQTLADAQNAIHVQGDAFHVEQYLTMYTHDQTRFYVLASPQRLDEAYNIQAAEVRKIIHHLRSMFDYVLLDTTSMFSVLNLSMLDMSTIVTFLGIVDFLPTIKNMKIGNDTLKNLNYDINKIRLVLNRSDSVTRISREDVEELLGESFDYILPNDFKAANRSIKDGVPLVLGGDQTPLGDALCDMAAQYTNRGLDDEVYDEGNNNSWFSRLFH